MHLHNPGIWAVGGTGVRGQRKEFVLTGNTLVLLHFGTPAPKKTFMASQEMPHLLSVKGCWNPTALRDAAGSAGRSQWMHPPPTWTGLRFSCIFSLPRKFAKKRKIGSAPHAQELIEAAKSNTQSKEKRVLGLLWAFRAALCVQITAQLLYWYPTQKGSGDSARLNIKTKSGLQDLCFICCSWEKP